jgi:3-keto-5-aminohexanoate cleavage enzyme
MPGPTVITVAPAGPQTAEVDAPASPVTTGELVRTAKACQQIGAAIVHLHVRDDQGRPTLDLARLRDTVRALREETDLVVQLATCGATDGVDLLRALEAEPDAATLDPSRSDAVELHTRMRDLEIVPAYGISGPGHLAALHRLLDEQGAPYGGHVRCELVLGAPGGLPGTAAALVAAVQALPAGATFSATGVGPTTLPVMLAALSAGGHLRVGMEDTLTYAPGEPARDNTQLVARAAGLARIAQRPPAPAPDARTLLHVRDR